VKTTDLDIGQSMDWSSSEAAVWRRPIFSLIPE